MWVKAFIVVFTGSDGQGRVSSCISLGWDSLNNFSGHWAIDVLFSYLVPRSGVSGQLQEPGKRRQGGHVASGWGGLHIRAVLKASCLLPLGIS